jgi:hypothetical protein
MTLKQILLDGAPGVTMTTANSGASNVTGPATNLNSAVFSAETAVHGPTGGLWTAVSGGNAAGCLSRFSFVDSSTILSFRGVLSIPAARPSADMPIWTGRSSSGRNVSFEYRPSGVLTFIDKANVLTDFLTAAQAPAGSKIDVALIITGGSTTASTVQAEFRSLDGTLIKAQTINNVNADTLAFSASDVGVIGTALGSIGWDDLQWDTGRTTFIPAYAPPANTAPVVDAGPDQDVAPGTVVTLKGTANDAESSVASQAWTCVSTPPGVSAPTITGANNLTATVALPAGITGRFRFEFKATDDSGATSVPDAVNVYVRGTTAKPTYDVSNSGPWSGAIGVLSDGSDATYSDSPEGTSVEAIRRIGLGPLKPPATFALTVRSLLTADAPTGVATLRLYEGTTLRKTWTATPTTTLASQTFTLTTAEIATITDWLALQLELSWKVA